MSQSLTFAYDAAEDRIAAVTDVNASPGPSFWLTRRMTLAFLHQASEHLEQTSAVAAHATADHRADVIAFEQEAALAATRNAISSSNEQALAHAKTRAVRASSIGLHPRGEQLRLVLKADGASASSEWSRPLLLRILKTLESEVEKAGWLAIPERPHAPITQNPVVRH